MQTPPLATRQSNDYGSPDGSQRVLFGTPNGTPKRTRCDPSSDEEDASGTSGHSFSLMGMLTTGFNREGEICNSISPQKKPRGPPPPPPPAPKKPQKKPDFLPLLMSQVDKSNLIPLGKGDYGTVFTACLPNPPGTPQLPPIAVKEIKFYTPGVCSSDLQDEVRRLGSPGCVTGVACRTDDSLQIFMPIGIQFKSLGFSKMTSVTLEWVIQSVKNIVTKKLVIGLLADIKPENFVLIPKGTATVVKDAKEQPCMGLPTKGKEVVYCDLGSVDPTSGGTKKYGVFPSVESDAKKAEFETKLRTFKATMMEALIRDAANPSGKTVEEIVAQCVPEGFIYAGGVQHQAQAQ